MRLLILSLALALLASPAWSAPAVRIIDGDTIVVGVEHVRIENLDAPEMPGHAKCAGEARKALEAKAALQKLIDKGAVTLVRNVKRPKDRYGRTLAKVYVGGKDVAPVLIKADLAREWKGKSSDWCKGPPQP